MPLPSAPPLDTTPARPTLLPEHTAPALDDLISRRPGFLVRNGTLIITGALLLLFGGTWFVRYPDVLEGSATLTSDPLPIQVKAPAAGRIQYIYQKENTAVQNRQPLLELENNTGLATIDTLSRFADSTLARLERADIAGLRRLSQTDLHSLGDGQRLYNALVDALNAYVLQKEANIYARRAASLQVQNQKYRALSTVSQRELRLIDEEIQQADERFRANEKLYQEKVISKLEYFEEAGRLRQKKLALEGQRRASMQNTIAITGNDKAELELSYDRAEKEQSQQTSIREQVRTLQNFIQEWRTQMLIVAPHNGIVHYARPIQVNEQVTAGEDLLTVIPTRYHYSALLKIPAENAGKLQAGQEVQLLLDQYPAHEYGYLRAKTVAVSELPNTAQTGAWYLVTAALPDTLVTSYRTRIHFKGPLTGKAKVITRERNLLQRLFQKFVGMTQ